MKAAGSLGGEFKAVCNHLMKMQEKFQLQLQALNNGKAEMAGLPHATYHQETYATQRTVPSEAFKIFIIPIWKR